MLYFDAPRFSQSFKGTSQYDDMDDDDESLIPNMLIGTTLFDENIVSVRVSVSGGICEIGEDDAKTRFGVKSLLPLTHGDVESKFDAFIQWERRHEQMLKARAAGASRTGSPSDAIQQVVAKFFDGATEREHKSCKCRTARILIVPDERLLRSHKVLPRAHQAQVQQRRRRRGERRERRERRAAQEED